MSGARSQRMGQRRANDMQHSFVMLHKRLVAWVRPRLRELMKQGGGVWVGAPAWVAGSKVWDPPPLIITAWVGGSAV